MESKKKAGKEEPIILWKDKKLVTGFVLVIASLVIGTYGKVLFIAKIYEPFYLITGLSLWAFSWLILLLGGFLIGWETIRVIQHRIHHHVKNTVKKSYHYTKKLPNRGYRYTKNLRNKGMKKLSETSRSIAKKFTKND